MPGLGALDAPRETCGIRECQRTRVANAIPAAAIDPLIAMPLVMAVALIALTPSLTLSNLSLFSWILGPVPDLFFKTLEPLSRSAARTQVLHGCLSRNLRKQWPVFDSGSGQLDAAAICAWVSDLNLRINPGKNDKLISYITAWDIYT